MGPYVIPMKCPLILPENMSLSSYPIKISFLEKMTLSTFVYAIIYCPKGKVYEIINHVKTV